MIGHFTCLFLRNLSWILMELKSSVKSYNNKVPEQDGNIKVYDYL